VTQQRAFQTVWFGLVVALSLAPIASAQEIRFDGTTFRVVGWDGIAEAAELSAEDHARLFAIRVDGSDASQLPPVGGSYRVEAEALIFEPRYPPVAGVSYNAIFAPAPMGLSGAASNRTFTVPRPITPPTYVEHVYPSSDVLPENQLKLYLHFSAPMARGEAYRHIRLLDEGGTEVELAFLEVDQELWTRDFRRLTLLFDPGRIKSGLVPNLEEGRPLIPGRHYTLAIGNEWRDATGRPLLNEYRKTFRVGQFDNIAPDISTWRLGVPSVGTRGPVTVEFPEPMDRGLVGDLLAIVDSVGERIEGTVDVDRRETRWLFVPVDPWPAGAYALEAGTDLEDLAGNALNGLFEVDLREVDPTQVTLEIESIPFAIVSP